MTDSIVLSKKKARKVAARAIRRVLEDRGYDNYAYDAEIFTEGIEEAARAVVKDLNYEELAELAWRYEGLS